jgi:hypothetical protein
VCACERACVRVSWVEDKLNVNAVSNEQVKIITMLVEHTCYCKGIYSLPLYCDYIIFKTKLCNVF